MIPAEADPEAFSCAVHDLVDAHWDAIAEPARQGHWKSTLRGVGLAVPMWPSVAGGPGWDATRKYLWCAVLAERGVLMPPDPGVDVVGPMFFAYAPHVLQVEFLPGIRDGVDQWCVGAAEADGLDLSGMTTTAVEQPDRRTAGNYRLSGKKCYVWAGQSAKYMLTLARLRRGYGLFVVALNAPGVTVEHIVPFDGGEPLATVTLTNVHIEGAHGFALDDPEEALNRLGGVAAHSGAALAQAQLDAIRAAAGVDEDIAHRCDELGVAVAALKAMELRFVDAESRGVDLPFPGAVIRAQSREILLQLGDLQLMSFGYYALPYPDEALLHNEGPIGPTGMTAAVRRNFASRVALQHEAVTSRFEDWKDEIARHLSVSDSDCVDHPVVNQTTGSEDRLLRDERDNKS